MTGMAAHGGVLPVGGTFFVFSDYMRGAVRLAALSDVHVIYSWTHDSVGLGQDGPTHQPVEQLAAMRAMPGLRLIRPADANETVAAWRIAVDEDGPDRPDPLPPVDSRARRSGRSRRRGSRPRRLRAARERRRGADRPHRHRQRGPRLPGGGRAASPADGVRVRVVSFPSWDLFEAQPADYRTEVLPDGLPRLAVEAAASFGWDRYADDSVSIDPFGASAPGLGRPRGVRVHGRQRGPAGLAPAHRRARRVERVPTANGGP